MTDQNSSAPAAEASALPLWKTVVYPLLFPVGDIKQLTFSEPNGEALEAIDDLGLPEEKDVNPSVKQVNALIAILSGETIDVVRKMNQRDISGAADAMVPLLEGATEK